MLDIGESLEAFLASRIYSKSPSIPFYSSVTAKQVTSPGSFNAAYWRQNFESPVLFSAAVEHLLDARGSLAPQLFLEVGPHGALAGPLRQILTACDRTKDSYLSAMTRGKDCSESILKLVGELFLKHVSVDFTQIAPAGNVLTDLPLYQWRHDKEYWSESRISREWRLRKFPQHELLGSRVLEGNNLEPQWRNVLRLEDVAWLRDHQIGGDIVFPCAGYLAMAIEAARQISPGTSSWTLRDTIVQSALVLSDAKPTEMTTSLRPVRLTNTLNSTWWDFSVISYNESTWIKHCIGQIRPESATTNVQQSATALKDYPRSVESPYTSMRRIGLNYGPHFQGLIQASCMPNEMKASATLSQTTSSDSKYAVHPTSIDHCLQLILLASCKGLLQRVTGLYVPTGIEYVRISDAQTSDGAHVHSSVEASSANVVSGSTVATSDAGVFLSLTGGKFSSLETDLSNDPDRLAAGQIDWKPHFDLADMYSLVRPSEISTVDSGELELVEKLTLLSILEINDRVSGITSTREHLQRYSKWIQAQISRAQQGQYDLVPSCAQLAALDRDDRLHLISELKGQIARSGTSSAAELISRIVDRCEDIVGGKVEGIEVLQPEDGLTNYYNFVESRTNSIDFFAVAGHSNPTLRVLEIGAGTGGGTAVVLQGLNCGGDGGERMYGSYTYTDISSGFFIAAQERFKQYPGIDFKVLDITMDPVEQGFDSGSFDLVIAGNVLHATPSLHQTLTNVRKLLAPHGCLFLQEVSPRMKMVNL